MSLPNLTQGQMFSWTSSSTERYADQQKLSAALLHIPTHKVLAAYFNLRNFIAFCSCHIDADGNKKWEDGREQRKRWTILWNDCFTGEALMEFWLVLKMCSSYTIYAISLGYGCHLSDLYTYIHYLWNVVTLIWWDSFLQIKVIIPFILASVSSSILCSMFIFSITGRSNCMI